MRYFCFGVCDLDLNTGIDLQFVCDLVGMSNFCRCHENEAHSKSLVCDDLVVESEYRALISRRDVSDPNLNYIFLLPDQPKTWSQLYFFSNINFSK